MTVTLKEEGPHVLISGTRYLLDEYDNVLHTWKSNSEWNSLPEAELELIKLISFNPILKFRIMQVEPNEVKQVGSSEDIANADSLEDPEGDQSI